MTMTGFSPRIVDNASIFSDGPKRGQGVRIGGQVKSDFHAARFVGLLHVSYADTARPACGASNSSTRSMSSRVL
jgi:hypothetical protein